MHLSISGTNLGVLIGSRNGQNLNSYFDCRNLDFNLPILVELLALLNFRILSIKRTLFFCPIWRIMVPLQLSKLARKHHCTELKSVWHFRACFLFRPSSSFEIAPILLLLQWIRMPFIIISFYFVALLQLQDNDGFSFLFDESLFPKSAAILLPLSGWQLHM